MTGERLDAVVDSIRTPPRSETESARAALLVSCSASDCHRMPLWPVDAARTVLGVRTLGNQAWDRREGRTVLEGNVGLLETEHDLATVLVVGHTGCQVLEDAYDRWAGDDRETPAGIQARLQPLRSLVGDAFQAGVLTDSMSPRTVCRRLVEYNVRRQVVFLTRELAPSITVAGYVHDQDGAYGSFPDERYLVALDGVTDPPAIRTRLPEDASVPVASLLS